MAFWMVEPEQNFIGQNVNFIPIIPKRFENILLEGAQGDFFEFEDGQHPGQIHFLGIELAKFRFGHGQIHDKI